MGANHSLSVSEWHRLSLEGTMLPVRTLVDGRSMEPLIRYNRDYVTIIPLHESLAEGDIVLFSDPFQKRYVVHRVWTLENERVLTWGDNCDRPDAWMTVNDIWGKVILIERGKNRITPNARRGLLFAGFWHVAGRTYRRLRRTASRAYHGIFSH